MDLFKKNSITFVIYILLWKNTFVNSIYFSFEIFFNSEMRSVRLCVH